MTIRTIGEWEFDAVHIESDYYIPFKVTWWPKSRALPLVMMIKGSNGGYVELKVDPDTGALLAVIAVTSPPVLTEDPRPTRKVGDVRQGKGARLSIAPWPQDVPTHGWNVLHVESQELAMYRAGDVTVLRFSQEPVATWLGNRHVVVGVSKNGSLVTVESHESSGARDSS